jgi:hypothetical protein
MTIPEPLRLGMLAFDETLMASRKPDVVIGSAEDPYVHRWWVGPHGTKPSAYLHKFIRSDGDFALHDHRYDNVSIILKGECFEHFHDLPLKLMGDDQSKYETRHYRREQGQVVSRKAADPHRIELIEGAPMISLFFTGEAYRSWGFSPPSGWLSYEAYNASHPDRDNGTYAPPKETT